MSYLQTRSQSNQQPQQQVIHNKPKPYNRKTHSLVEPTSQHMGEDDDEDLSSSTFKHKPKSVENQQGHMDDEDDEEDSSALERSSRQPPKQKQKPQRVDNGLHKAHVKVEEAVKKAKVKSEEEFRSATPEEQRREMARQQFLSIAGQAWKKRRGIDPTHGWSQYVEAYNLASDASQPKRKTMVGGYNDDSDNDNDDNDYSNNNVTKVKVGGKDKKETENKIKRTKHP